MAEVTIYWEDFALGQVRELGSLTVSRGEILTFARQFDPQPFHLDDEAAKASVFGGLCASGWHTCALAMRLMVTNFLHQTSSLGSPGLEDVRWHKPVFPGDTLSLRHTILATKPMRKRADVGLVQTRWDMFNQHDETVLTMNGWAMFRRRAPATDL